MSHTPEQMRQKEAAQQEAERQKMYAADGLPCKGNSNSHMAHMQNHDTNMKEGSY